VKLAAMEHMIICSCSFYCTTALYCIVFYHPMGQVRGNMKLSEPNNSSGMKHGQCRLQNKINSVGFPVFQCLSSPHLLGLSWVGFVILEPRMAMLGRSGNACSMPPFQL